jgi:RHS repeat-associated protein
VSSSGTWSGPFGYAGNFGYQQDASGLKLLGHRYYDPSTGRFLTRDPIKDGRNWYAYGAGEAAPTNIADPTGLEIRDPNPKELEHIERAISHVDAVDPAKAKALRKLLKQRRIKVEAQVGHNGYLGKMDAGIIYVWSGILNKPVILSSVLVHELIHIDQNKQGRVRRGITPRQREVLEAEARQEQLDYLDKLHRAIPRLKAEIDTEIRRVREQARRGR